jgi:hypothetical protein
MNSVNNFYYKPTAISYKLTLRLLAVEILNNFINLF